MRKYGLDDLPARDLHHRHVLLRVDFNVPLKNGEVADDWRIRAALPTIRYLIEQQAKVALVTHLGQPVGIDDRLRLDPVARRLAALLGQPVAKAHDTIGPDAHQKLARLNRGQVLMLENVRFHPEETANDPQFARVLADWAHYFVNDAFGVAHRAHASNVGVTAYLPALAGFLLQREIDALSRLLQDPERPFVAVVGGAKVSSKLPVLWRLVQKADALVLGGGLANTFLAAQGHSVGLSRFETALVPEARALLDMALKMHVSVILPRDVVLAHVPARESQPEGMVPVTAVPDDKAIADIGVLSTDAAIKAIERARTIAWNGPMGVTETSAFRSGSAAILYAMASATARGAFTVIGGGETVELVTQLGMADQLSHVSTGGGAMLVFLAGEPMPALDHIPDI